MAGLGSATAAPPPARRHTRAPATAPAEFDPHIHPVSPLHPPACPDCLPCLTALPACPALPAVPAGMSVSHIKEVPGWSERLASDAEAVVKAERDVRHQLRRAALHCPAPRHAAPYVAVLRRAVSCAELRSACQCPPPLLAPQHVHALDHATAVLTPPTHCAALQCPDCSMDEMQRQTVETLQVRVRPALPAVAPVHALPLLLICLRCMPPSCWGCSYSVPGGELLISCMPP